MSEQEKQEFLKTVNGLLGLVSEYWQTFKLSDNTVAAWAIPLVEYSKPEMWEALKSFQHEEERVFAPSVSEFIGRMDYYRERRANEKAQQFLLEAPASKNRHYEPMETYTYQTSRTTPKRKQDESDFEVRKAVRQTREAKKDYEGKMIANGFVKRLHQLAGGKMGSSWHKG